MMQRLLLAFLVWSCGFAIGYPVNFDQIVIEVPNGWKVEQQFEFDGVVVLGLSNGSKYMTFYSSPNTNLNMKSIFVNDAEIEQDVSTTHYTNFSWKKLVTSKRANFEGGTQKNYMTSFLGEVQNKSYFGYSRGSSRAEAESISRSFLEQVKLSDRSKGRSLTGTKVKRRKYYLGFGRAGQWDPSQMHNEVKYDVLHTHDIFSRKVGGNYESRKLIGSGATASQVRMEWNRFKSTMLWNDMFVQYSSGHGHSSGLEIGISYNEIRDTALSFPAKEIVIFIMACKSGGLVNSFNQKKQVWQNWGKYGRSLLVMSSSKMYQDSATGPGTDSDQPGSPNGSAGSAFGHALWKALIGYADGDLDGVKDGFVSLGEIEHYTRWKTQQVGGHTPQVTGVYNRNVIMNKVPSRAFLASLPKSTEGLSDDEVMKLVSDLNHELKVK